MSRGTHPVDREVTDPSSLRFVGPATVDVIDRAAFDVADLVARRVSYRELVDAGVDPSVAERLRCEYSLVWSFEWQVGGDDLPRRAARLQALGPVEREWIAASATDVDCDSAAESLDEDPKSVTESTAAVDESVPLEDRGWPAIDPAEQPDATDSDGCPRCGADLVTYVLGDHDSEFCESCGYSGVSTVLGSDDHVWETAVDRLLSGH